MSLYYRRKFLKDSSVIAAGAVALTIPGIGLAQEENTAKATFTVQRSLILF